MVLGELRATMLVGDEAKFGLIYSILFKVLCDQERKDERRKKKEEEKASEDQED